MGFIAPKVKIPSAPVAPEPAPVAEVDEVKNDVHGELSEKRRKRKGLEATILTQNDSSSPGKNSSSGKSDYSMNADASSSPAGTGTSGDRKTLG